ncbi:hypothetical protein D3C81_1957670 [compost metagenome]
MTMISFAFSPMPKKSRNTVMSENGLTWASMRNSGLSPTVRPGSQYPRMAPDGTVSSEASRIPAIKRHKEATVWPNRC